MNSTKPKHWKQIICDILHISIILLSCVLIVSISVETLNNVSFVNQGTYLKTQFWICIFFLLDFFIELCLSDTKLQYFKKHFIFLVISIPYLNIINYFELSLPSEISYLIQFMPLLRGGYALAIVVNWLTQNKASSLFITYILFLVTIIYFASLSFFVIEHKVNPQVTCYQDSLWWAFMNVTTLGSNIYAKTGIGKILTVLLGALGMMLFPVFTVYLTTLIQKTNKRSKNKGTS